MACMNFNVPLLKCKDITNLDDKFPNLRKAIKLIDKKAVLKEVAYAGNGSFDKDGEFYNIEKDGHFKYKIVYYSNDILECITPYNTEPKEFIWVLNKIRN